MANQGQGRRAKSLEFKAVQDEFVNLTRQALVARGVEAVEALQWLRNYMPPYFFITMREETEAILALLNSLRQVLGQVKLNLLEEETKLIVARRDLPGSLYETLKTLRERAVSYAEMTHSIEPMPGSSEALEVQKFEFDRKSPAQIAAAGPPQLPRGLLQPLRRTLHRLYPRYEFSRLRDELWLLWLNNPAYVRLSPPERLARVLWLYQQGRRHEGLYLAVEQMPPQAGPRESRVLFAVGNPPHSGFLAQAMEVFARLRIGVQRFYALNVCNRYHGYFLGTFYVFAHDRVPIKRGSRRFAELQSELYNTQILDAASEAYRVFLPQRVMSGEEATLANAFSAFCHTSLAHSQPHRFSRQEVEAAFIGQPGITRQICDLFRARFAPGVKGSQGRYQRELKKAHKAVEGFNTGHRRLDELRRIIYRTCLLFICRTLKTNFFVPEKHALAFRLDPAYLAALDPEITVDLPRATPFRITFFFGRHGVGYHVGFSDIARGGWRTIICRSSDEFVTNTNSLFKETFVLAHTQHLKNKDIYEGGSKMAVALNAVDLASQEEVTQRLYKLQYGFTNAFLDLFVTRGGVAANPRVKDYYRDQEPIELGPDENMHDAMIEQIARMAQRRGYVLGPGIISSKELGINHKQYGVTSRGVMRFAAIAMKQVGIDVSRDPFTVKMTGGPYGDVAGNCLKLMLEACPRAQVRCIIEGHGAVYDPQGVDLGRLAPLLLKERAVALDPQALHPGGFVLFRHEQRREGLRTLFRKLSRHKGGVKESWISNDELQRELDALLFSGEADLFLPCGGRPETIDEGNWRRLLDAKGRPNLKVIVEGANSFISPPARQELQQRGVIVLRDASANKCGVISSSYEILANLLMRPKEFAAHKEQYVADVLAILERRAEDEAKLIFRRHAQHRGEALFTEITTAISSEINRHYARLFDFFTGRPQLLNKRLFRQVILRHLPAFLRDQGRYRARLKELPVKMLCAIAAVEIATMIVYGGGWQSDLEARLETFIKQNL